MIRVVIVSDVRLYREGLLQILSGDGRPEVHRAAEEADVILDQDDAPSRPDVVLLDMGSPNALDSARELADRLPEFKAIALGVVEERDEVVACAEARVASYVSRDASLDDLVEAVVGAIRGVGIVGRGGWSWPHPDPELPAAYEWLDGGCIEAQSHCSRVREEPRTGRAHPSGP